MLSPAERFLQLPPAQQYAMARGYLMTGPRSQEPTFRAIRKTVRRLLRGDDVVNQPGWRQAPK